MSNTGRRTQATHIAAKFEKCKKGKFVDNAYAQLWAGNKAVYKDYFTDDFNLENPEFHLISPTKYLEGDFALETMSRLFRADGNSWSKIEDEVMWEVDAGDKFFGAVVHAVTIAIVERLNAQPTWSRHCGDGGRLRRRVTRRGGGRLRRYRRLRRRRRRGWIGRTLHEQFLPDLQKVAWLKMIELLNLVYRDAISQRHAEQRVAVLHHVNGRAVGLLLILRQRGGSLRL